MYYFDCSFFVEFFYCVVFIVYYFYCLENDNCEGADFYFYLSRFIFYESLREHRNRLVTALALK